MTVELRYNRRVNGVAPDAAAQVLQALDELDGGTSDTGGTYTVSFVRYQFDQTDAPSELHLDVGLTDEDDDQFPQCKDDFATTLAELTTIDLGDAAAIKQDITGRLLSE